MIAATYSDFGDLRAWYFFLYPQGGNTQAQFRLSDAGIDRPVFLYDYFAGAGRVVRPTECLSEDVGQYRYLVAAPIGKSGIALLGDTGHFVTLGKKRVTSLADDGVVHVSLAFAAGESARTIEGYSPVPPAATALDGAAGPLSYNAATGRFTLIVLPGPDGLASLQIARALQKSGPPALRRRDSQAPRARSSGTRCHRPLLRFFSPRGQLQNPRFCLSRKLAALSQFCYPKGATSVWKRPSWNKVRRLPLAKRGEVLRFRGCILQRSATAGMVPSRRSGSITGSR